MKQLFGRDLGPGPRAAGSGRWPGADDDPVGSHTRDPGKLRDLRLSDPGA